MLDAGDQHLDAGLMQHIKLRRSECAAWSSGMYAGKEKRFVDVNIAEPRDEMLIQEQRFDRRRSAFEYTFEIGRRKGFRQRLRSEPGVQRSDIRFGRRLNATELALIGKTELVAIVERQR